MKSIIFLVIFVFFVFHSTSKPLNPKKVLYAVDCGSNSITKSSLGFIYQKDEGYSTSRIADYSENPDVAHIRIKYTFDQNVYKTERHHDDSFTYSLPLALPGKFTLILKFAELYFKEPNRRVFNVKLGSCTVLKNVDSIAKVGPFAANDEYVEFELRDDQIFYNNQLCEKAYKAKKNQLVVELEKGEKDLPNIQGIILYDGGIEETDYSDIQEFRSQWQAKLDEEIRIEEEEKQRKIQQKKSLLENLGEEVFKFEEYNEPRLQGIIRILSSTEGFYIIGTLLSCFILLKLFGRDNTEKN